MPEETMEVPSEETEVETPSEQPEEGAETPMEATPEATPEAEVPAEPELYELPDGRKVDAETLSKEWKENFYPEFTRKSQELAKTKSQTEKSPYEDPMYTPQSYEEILKEAENRVLKTLEAKQQAEIESRQALENEISTQLNELKKADASLNENLLFVHANKYGFRDLKVAYQNMKDMNLLAKNVQKTTAKNMQKRAAEPIATNPSNSSGTAPDPSMFENARDFLRSLK